ncbi:MAG: hypothetical protein FWG99_11525 [Treponema sp.]|nr:hypothetical protein [Treponema sp.]
MKRIYIFVILFTLAVFAFAQSRDDVSIYFPPVLASPEQAEYLHNSFSTEAFAAGYIVTSSRLEADYVIELEVRPNIIIYDDGTEEPAPPDEEQFVLRFALIRNEDNEEILFFSYLFTDLLELSRRSLYLLNEAMANVPVVMPPENVPITVPLRVILTRMGPDEEFGRDDRWRNKWVYFRASFDYPITIHALEPDKLYDGSSIYNGDINNPPVQFYTLDNKVEPAPALTFGLELQLFNWMSLEFDFEMKFEDPEFKTYIPVVGAQLKFPLKPSGLFMLEPYAAASYYLKKPDYYESFSGIEAGGGIQFGAFGGSRGVWFFDARFMYTINGAGTYNLNTEYPNPEVVQWNRFIIGIGVGYKLGFFDRKSKQ